MAWARRAVAPAVLEHQLCFFQKSCFQHAVHPGVDAPVELRAVRRRQGRTPANRTAAFQAETPPAAGSWSCRWNNRVPVLAPHAPRCWGEPWRRSLGPRPPVFWCMACGPRSAASRSSFSRKAGSGLLLGKAHAVQKAFNVKAGAAHQDGQLPQAQMACTSRFAASTKSATLKVSSGGRKSIK